MSNVAVAFCHADRGCRTPPHNPCNQRERSTRFQHARAAGVPKVMESALDLRAGLGRFPCLFPASNWLCRVRVIGACREFVSGGPVALRRKHVVRWLPLWKVAGPEL